MSPGARGHPAPVPAQGAGPRRAEPSHGRVRTDAARGCCPVPRSPPVPVPAASAAVPQPGGLRSHRVQGAAHPGVFGEADVRAGGQRRGLPALRAVVPPLGRAVPPRPRAAGRARGRLPAPPRAVPLRGGPGAPADPGGEQRLPALQAPGDAVALRARAAGTDGHLLAGFLGLLRVPLGAALPAGWALPGRGGEADGGRLRGPGAGALRAAGCRPPRAASSAPGLSSAGPPPSAPLRASPYLWLFKHPRDKLFFLSPASVERCRHEDQTSVGQARSRTVRALCL